MLFILQVSILSEQILVITLLAPSPYQPKIIMIKGGSITLTSKDILLRFPTQIQAELRYLWNSGLALRAFSFMTPMEESKPPSLVETFFLVDLQRLTETTTATSFKKSTFRTSHMITYKLEDAAPPDLREISCCVAELEDSTVRGT